jgi:hypothetical protein
VPQDKGAPNLLATSHMFAGALFSLLDLWIRDGMTATPADMDALFHRTLCDGLASPTHEGA